MAGIAFLAARDGLPAMDWHIWTNDFDFYLATDWVITETGSGTRAISQAKDGILVVTNGSNDDDANNLQARQVASGQVAENWKWISGKQLYFGCRLKVSDATQSDLVVGLHITDTSPIASAPSDGFWFRKDDGDRLLDFVVQKNSTGSTVTGILGKSGYLTDDTYTVLEFLYDGSTEKVTAWQDGVCFGGNPLTNVCDDEELVVSFAIQNGEAVAKVLSLDWIRVAQERGT